MMNNGKKTKLLLLSTAALMTCSVSVHAADWRVNPSISVSETYTDNVDLDASSQQSDFVTRVTPQIAITGVGARLNASLIYAGNYFYYPGDDTDKHDYRHNLQANLNSELVDDLFFVDSSASINQRFLDRRNAISASEVSRTQNRRTVQTYSFSPYLVHEFGSWASAQLRYRLHHVRESSDTQQTTVNTVFGNTLGHEGSLSVNSGSRFTRLNWNTSFVYWTEEREVSSDFSSKIGRLDMSYQVTKEFAVLGSAGYQKRLSGGTFGDFDGFIWDAGFRLAPGPRTSISFRYGNQYEGDTFSLSAFYKMTAKSTISLSYTDVLQTFQSLALEDNGGTNFNTTQESSFISGDLTRRKRWSLSINGERGRTSYGISSFYSDYKSENTALDEERYGGSISLQRTLNRRLNVATSFSYNHSKFLSDSLKDTFWSASASMNYSISKSLVGSLEYVHSDRDQNRFGNLNGGSNYISLSIRASL